MLESLGLPGRVREPRVLNGAQRSSEEQLARHIKFFPPRSHLECLKLVSERRSKKIMRVVNPGHSEEGPGSICISGLTLRLGRRSFMQGVLALLVALPRVTFCLFSSAFFQ